MCALYLTENKDYYSNYIENDDLTFEQYCIDVRTTILLVKIMLPYQIQLHVPIESGGLSPTTLHCDWT